MPNSRFNLYLTIAAIVAVVGLSLLVWLNREPAFNGKKASVWFAEATQRPDQSFEYGKIFVGWSESGAAFLAKRLVPPEQSELKIRLIAWYNRYCYRVGLLPIANHASSAEQKTARRLLGYFESAAVSPLVEMLNSRSEQRRLAAIQAMSELGPGVADELGPHLVPLLNDPSPTIQYEAITTLATIDYDPPLVIPLIVPFLTNSNSRVRIEASYALGSYPPWPETTLDALVIALNDSDQVVRANSVRALGKMGKDANPALGSMAKMLENVSGIVAARLVEALPYIGKMNDLSSDSTYLRELNRALYDPDKYESMMASRAQLRLGHSAMQMQTACSALLNSQSNWQVWEAVDALAEYEPRRDWTIKLLEKATRHPNGLVRAKAEMALER